MNKLSIKMSYAIHGLQIIVISVTQLRFPNFFEGFLYHSLIPVPIKTKPQLMFSP